MVIIGCDFHPGFQQIAMVKTDSGEVRHLQLMHKQEAERFYASLRGEEVLVGIEACGYTQWFEQMLEQMGHRFRWGMRRPSVPVMCAGRRRIGAMPATFFGCW